MAVKRTIDINADPTKIITEDLPEMEAAMPAPEAKAEIDLYNQPGVEAEINALSKATADALKKYPHHKIVIPPDQFNPKNIRVSHCVNGFVRYFMRNMPILVDDPTIDDLQKAGYNPTITL
jgi:hypothetical protein